METIFFYGLFMDEGLLKGKGLHPVNKKVAVAEGYGLRIGEKATLINSPKEKTYEVVMGLTREEEQALYSIPGVEEYEPETITVTGMDGASFKAICYNLPVSKLTGTNKAYARSLAELSHEFEFP